MKNLLSKFLNSSIRYQLISGLSLVLLIIIVVFTFMIIKQQQSFLHSQGIKETQNRSIMLGVNAKVWILSNDYLGLQEVINSFKIYDNLIYASIVNMDGKVIAHTDIKLVGKYIADEESKNYLQSMLHYSGVHTNEATIISQNDTYIDIVQVVHNGDDHIAFVHLRTDQTSHQKNIHDTIIKGIIFTISSLIIAILFSIITTNILTKQLSKLISKMKEIRKGSKNVRANGSGALEVRTLSNEFNMMLDTLEENQKALESTQNELKEDIKQRIKSEKEIKNLNENLENIVKQRTQELVIEKDKAETANRSKSIFLANMSHELRTPLNAILGFSQLMSDSPDTSKSQKENLNIIANSGAHLLSLINDVLDMSKIEAGRMELSNTKVDLHKTLNEIANMMRIKADSKDIQFTLEMSENLVHYIDIDEKKLRQILINIIGNSIKYTDTGGISFRIRSILQKQTAEITFEIEDSGRGMSKEELKNIFDPFVQAKSSKGINEGTGLGLAITHRFLELLDAKVKVESQRGKGTLFSFTVVVKTAQSEDILVEDVHKKVIGIQEGYKKFKILIVEDQKENLLLLNNLLSGIGFDVYEARNGKIGLEKFIEIKPDFIWMDMRMPVMDGYESTSKIRALDKNVIIVALTASAFSDQRPAITKAGCNDLVHKPYRHDEIFNTMKKYLDIEFIYQDLENESVQKPLSLDTVLFKKIPKNFVESLKTALVSLDPEEILQQITLIQQSVPEIGESMLPLAQNYEYDQLLKFLEQGENDG